MFTLLKVETSVLLGACQARGRLSDVDVSEDVSRGVWLFRRGTVLVDIKCNCSHSNALTSKVADALEGEDGL